MADDSLDGFLNSYRSTAPVNGEYVPVDSFMDDYLEEMQWTASGQLIQPMDSQPMDFQISEAGASAQLHNQPPSLPPNRPANKIVQFFKRPKNQQIETKQSRQEHQKRINREAQQRFRQRNRARQAAMNATHAELTKELEELQLVSQEANQAQEKVNAMEEQMKLLEAELEVVRKTAEDMKQQNQKSEESYSFEARDAVRNMYVSLSNLRLFIRSKSMDKIGSVKEGSTIEETDSKKIQEMVGKSGEFCVNALRKEGPIDIWMVVKAMATNHRDLLNGGVSPWTQKLPQEWISIATNLQLSDKQIFDILVCRQEYVDRISKLLTKRQEINYKIISMLLPNSSSLDQSNGNIDLIKMQEGNSADLENYVKSLRQNLSQEQLYHSKLDEIAFNLILTPLQGAWFMLESLPEHCDIVALQNAVYEVYGHKIKIDRNQRSLHTFQNED